MIKITKNVGKRIRWSEGKRIRWGERKRIRWGEGKRESQSFYDSTVSLFGIWISKICRKLIECVKCKIKTNLNVLNAYYANWLHWMNVTGWMLQAECYRLNVTGWMLWPATYSSCHSCYSSWAPIMSCDIEDRWSRDVIYAEDRWSCDTYRRTLITWRVYSDSYNRVISLVWCKRN